MTNTLKKTKYYLVNQSCGPLFVDIANEFTKKGLDTILISGEINKGKNQLDPQIEVKKLNRYNKSNLLKRLASWINFAFSLFFKILFAPTNSKWLISTNPPLAPWFSRLLKIKGCKVVLLIYDIYPEALVAGKIISEKNILYRIWHSITQHTYNNALQIICIGDTMSEYLISQNNKLASKIITIPNWNTIDFKPYEKKGRIYKTKRHAENKIHIVYSGNLGATHDFTTILETAKALKNDDRFVFSIIGDGYQKDFILNFIKNNELKNIIWETFKPVSEIADVYLSADISLVTMGEGIEKASIPSKTFNVIAAGSAILAISPEGSELQKLVVSKQIGCCFKPGEVEKVIHWLKELADNEEKLLKFKTASKKLSEKYSPKNAAKYVSVLTRC